LYAASYPCPLAVSGVIALVGLEDKDRARVKTLSGGQRRRLDLAFALIGDPDLIFLDEPTTGFDPAARRVAWALIERLRGLGRTIVLTSHYMDEVQHLADRVAVIANGRIVAAGRPDSLGRSGPRESVISFRLPGAQTLAQLPYELRRVVESEDGEVTIRTTEPVRVLSRLCEWAVQRDLDLPGLEVVHTSLEDVYLQLTEDGLDGGDRA
jgi:ABC-2 type transport system ATP-binding protein